MGHTSHDRRDIREAETFPTYHMHNISTQPFYDLVYVCSTKENWKELPGSPSPLPQSIPYAFAEPKQPSMNSGSTKTSELELSLHRTTQSSSIEKIAKQSTLAKLQPTEQKGLFSRCRTTKAFFSALRAHGHTITVHTHTCSSNRT